MLLIGCVGFSFSQPDDDNSSEAATRFNIAAAKHRRELRDLIQQRGLDPIDHNAITLSILTASLQRHAGNIAVAFYDRSPDSLFIWLVKKEGLAASSSGPITSGQLEMLVSSLRTSLHINAAQSHRLPIRRGVEVVDENEQSALPLDSVLQSLTEVLLPSSLRSSLQSVEHLVVVPSGNIGTIPFALLKPFGDSTFLIDHMSVSVAPSLFDVKTYSDATSPTRTIQWTFDNPLVVGNPSFFNGPEWSLPPLPGAEAEAREVGRLIHATPLLGTAATKKEVLKHAASADFLYFATHGVADAVDPIGKSFLAFSPDSNTTGFWSAGEIQRSRLSADIAVLSACQTGLGRTHDAGIIGIARAFQIAGVKEVIMSLWSVDDDATSELMQLFVQKLRKPSHFFPAAQLREAILEFKTKKGDPNKWAPFVVFGVPM
jgi:CHAT domain-containing protein